MVAITLEALINSQKELIVTLPDDVHIGRVKVTIEPLDALETDAALMLTADVLRQRLMAAGALVTDWGDDLEPSWDEDSVATELAEISRRSLVGRPSEEMIDEDRGEQRFGGIHTRRTVYR